MKLERRHKYAIAGAVVLILIVLIVRISKSSSSCKPEPQPKPAPSYLKRCDNTTSELIDFQISNCKDAMRTQCKLKRGSNFDVTLKFKNGDKYKKALSEIQLPGGAYGEDACDIGLECPAEAGKVQTLKHMISIYSHMTPGRGLARLRVLNDKVEPIICLNFPVEIV